MKSYRKGGFFLFLGVTFALKFYFLRKNKPVSLLVVNLGYNR